MEIEEVDIRKVIPNPENPRFIRDENFEKLVRSIEEFPEMLKLRPIVVNEGMVTLGGNMRLRACKEAGLKKVPVIRVSLTKEQEKEFIIKDNLGYGEWDWEMLANEWDVELLNMWGLEVDLWKKDDDEEDEYGKEEELKMINLNVKEGDYREALELIKWHKKRGAYVGGMLIKFLKAEKNQISL
jgi:ParB-like chromosome segregation protein Spo0J